MKDKHKKMILLTIQDLKDLGVIGKKKKGRRKKRRVINKINSQTQIIQPPNPYFQSQTFTNNSNLDTENKRLQNEALSSEVAIRNFGSQNQNNIIQNKAFDDLQNSHNEFKNASINALMYLRNRFDEPQQQSRFINISSNIDMANNNYENDNDNIDVPEEEGSDNMIAEGTSIPEVQSDTNSVLSWGMNYKAPAATQDDNHTLISDIPSISSESYHAYKTPVGKSKIELLHQEAFDIGMDPKDFTPNMKSMRAKIKHQEVINELVYEYQEAGGIDDKVYESNSVIVLNKHILILKLQQEYLSLNGTDENITNSFDPVKIRRAIKTIKVKLKSGMDNLIDSQPNKINSYFK